MDDAPDGAPNRLDELDAALRAWVEAQTPWLLALFLLAVFVAVHMLRSGRARGRDLPCGPSPPSIGLLVALMGMACFLTIGTLGRAAWGAASEVPPWLMPAASFAASLGAVVVMAVALRAVGVRPRALGLASSPGRPIAFAVVVYVATLPVLGWLSSLAQELTGGGAQEQVVALLRDGDPWSRALMFASVCIGAPVFEELLFRGLLLASLRRWFGPIVAVIGSAALFAVVHPSFTHLPIFWLGLVLGAVYHYTGSLAAPIALHALHNGLQFAWITALSSG